MRRQGKLLQVLGALQLLAQRSLLQLPFFASLVNRERPEDSCRLS